jgi:hypothetical protein
MDMYCFDLMERLGCEEKATRFAERRNFHKKRRALLAALWFVAVRVRGVETSGRQSG